MQYTGLTALATFALLEAGESPQDPHLKSAIAFLKATETKGTYALALRCQVWNLIPPDESLKAVMRLEVYVNGVLAASAAGYVGSYVDLPMSKAGRDAIKSGQNVISVHCHQTDGAQVIDVGIGAR